MVTSYISFTADNVKKFNRYAILDLIRFAGGGISRVELARRMGLTRAAVTAIVNELMDAGLVCEAESLKIPSGRRPVVLEIDADRGFVIGVDTGATHIRLMLADFASHTIAEVENSFDINRGPEMCLFEVDALLRQLLEKAGLSLEQICAVGVGVPGPIDTGLGGVSGPPIMPGWDGYPIRDHLEELWHCPVTINNDAELGALGEWAYGAGRGEQNLVYLKVGMGIGAGLILDGQIYHGKTGSAGEIGHITIEENGPLCTCGNRGCLEAMAGGKAIGYRAAEAVRRGQRTQLAEIVPPEKISAHDVMAAARSGDLLAQQIVHDAGVHLGTAVASLVNLINPGMVVVGGGVAQIGDLLLEPIRQAVLARSLKPASGAVRITTALLERRSVGMGAVVQALSIALRTISDRKEVRVKEDEYDETDSN